MADRKLFRENNFVNMILYKRLKVCDYFINFIKWHYMKLSSLSV